MVLTQDCALLQWTTQFNIILMEESVSVSSQNLILIFDFKDMIGSLKFF